MELIETLISQKWFGWVVGGGAFVYLGLPMLIYLTFSQKTIPQIEAVDPDNPLPEKVRKYFSLAYEGFHQSGFQYLGSYLLAEQTNNVQTILALYVNEQSSTSGMAVAMYGDINGKWKIQALYSEFSSEFDDGFFVDTGNQKVVNAFPPRPNSVRSSQPRLKDVAQLYRAHQTITEHHSGTRRPVLRLFTDYNGDCATELSQGMTREMEAAKRIGYLKHAGGERPEFSNAFQGRGVAVYDAASVPSEYRATLFGAFLMTWKQLWPFKPFVTWMTRRRDRRMLEEAGWLG